MLYFNINKTEYKYFKIKNIIRKKELEFLVLFLFAMNKEIILSIVFIYLWTLIIFEVIINE